MNSARAGATERLPHDLGLLLDRLATELEKPYGERYRGLVLYAARAKWALALEAGYIVSLLTVNVETYRDSQQPFSRSARNEGVSLP
jgi:hypothetical protein